MHHIDPSWPLPDDLDTPVWRYIDIFKFKDLLEKEALYFRRADSLQDEHEGNYPTLVKNGMKEYLTNIGHPELINDQLEHFELRRRQTFISSWSLGSENAEFMWSSYIKEPPGLALRSTVRRLDNLCFNAIESWPIQLAVIKYVDFEDHEHIDVPGFKVFFHKDREFEKENEIRIIRHLNCNDAKDHVYVKFSLDEIVSCIVLGSESPSDEQADQIERIKIILREKFSNIPLLERARQSEND